MARFSTLKPYREIWVQGIFWLCYFLFEWLNTGAYMENYQKSLYFITLNLPIIVLAGYWHLLVTVRHFLLSGRMPGFWASLIGGVLAFGLLRRAINYTWFYPVYFPQGLLKSYWYWPKILAESMHLHLVIALFVAVN
ncbi:MAG: hypothetical protein EOO39_39580, partial [Cytophagaceae bacterium]